MTGLVPDDERDRLFLYATEAVHDPGANRWDVSVDPDDCLATIDEGRPYPTVSELQAESVTVTETCGTRRYEGRILLGAGVVPLVGEAVPLIFRDADAPTSPLRWTAPAGRVDDDPEATALREFYEELVVLRDGTPAYVDVGTSHRDVYRETVAATGRDPGSLTTVSGTVPDRFRHAFDTVVTHVGDDRVKSDLWTTFVPSDSSLEFRTVVSFGAEPASLSFRDGEFDRCVELFPVAELAAVPAASLVPGLAAFRDTFFGAD